jgi:hypothetical protein
MHIKFHIETLILLGVSVSYMGFTFSMDARRLATPFKRQYFSKASVSLGPHDLNAFIGYPLINRLDAGILREKYQMPLF